MVILIGRQELIEENLSTHFSGWASVKQCLSTIGIRENRVEATITSQFYIMVNADGTALIVLIG